MLQLGGMLSKLMQLKYSMDGGLGAKPPVSGNFRDFLKKIAFLTQLESNFASF